jgi:hypothetical protein
MYTISEYILVLSKSGLQTNSSNSKQYGDYGRGYTIVKSGFESQQRPIFLVFIVQTGSEVHMASSEYQELL